MTLLAVGSVALDSVETPQDSRNDVLGGSAVFFSYAASYFTPVNLVGVVGEDWPEAHTELLRSRKVDTAGLKIEAGKETFRWRGRYLPNMNDRETLELHLNVFGEFNPIVPEQFRNSDYLFLANGVPQVQLEVLSQVANPKLVVADTMDIWITEHTDDLKLLLGKIDGLVLNDAEAKLLTGEQNIIAAGKKILELGPRFAVVKKGEHGAMYFGNDATYVLPAYPTDQVVDPTGAGDSFAGGMMGYITEQDCFDAATMKKALAYGVLVASFNVEDFSLDQMRRIERSHIDERMREFETMLSF